MKRIALILMLVIFPVLEAESVKSSENAIKAFYGPETPPVVVMSICIVKRSTVKTYRSHMRFLESTNDYNKIHPSGAIGAYGFMPSTLKDLGIEIDTGAFRANPALFPPSKQEEVMRDFTANNERLLRDLIETHRGDTIKGVTVTRAGILAAAHLGGAGAVQEFFASGYVAEDDNGTSLLDYMKQFENIKN